MSPTRNSNVRLLGAAVDWDDDGQGEYRFLVDDKHVKYVTIDAGVLPKDDRTFAPILIPLLPPFPSGEWNEGHVSKGPLGESPFFSHYTRSDLPGISNAWHRMRIDHLEFKELRRLRQNIHVVTHPRFDHALVAKYAEFPWQMPDFEAETAAYEWVDGHGVGPKLVAHLTEAGRVIGFVLEHIEGARAADKGDLSACQEVLARLHSLGIKHGDINKYNFLVREGKAFLVDFESAQRCSEKEELEAEYQQLEHSLSDQSQEGIPYPEHQQAAFALASCGHDTPPLANGRCPSKIGPLVPASLGEPHYSHLERQNFLFRIKLFLQTYISICLC